MAKWKDFSILKKLFIGFGCILLLLTISGFLSMGGIKNILSRIDMLNDNNHVKQLLTEKEVDHLNWAQKVNELFTDKLASELNVETDDHKCGLGKWLYGPERKHAENIVPELTGHLKKLEITHAELHSSAIEIKNVFHQADDELPLKILEIDRGHHVWAGKIRDALINQDNSLKDVQFDPEKCKLGVFLNSEQGKYAYLQGDSEFKSAWNEILIMHDSMHESAIKINSALKQNDFEHAGEIFRTTTLPNLNKTGNNLTLLHNNTLEGIKGKKNASAIFTTKTVQRLHEVQSQLGRLRQEMDTKIKGVNSDIERSFYSIRNIIVGVFVISLVIGLIITFNVSNITSRPIARSVQLAQTMAQGDLTDSIDLDQKDEVGTLVSALNVMSSNIREIVNNIFDDSNQVAASSEELRATSHQLASASEEMTSQSSKVAASTEQINVNMNNVTLVAKDMSKKVDSVALSASSMSVNVNSVAASIEEMTSSIREVSSNCSKASEYAGEASEISNAALNHAEELNKSSQDIGSIISIINQVTEQTKLLALNATIEAARAGESGKGFAVVAGEVKELAKQTADATAKIAGQIEEMQHKTESIVQSINNIARVNNKSNDITTSIAASVEQQSVTANDIAMVIANTSKESSAVSDTIQGLSKKISQDVLSNLTEVAAGVEEVARNIHSVNTVSVETARSATSINDSAKELASLANRLLVQVNKFKVEA